MNTGVEMAQPKGNLTSDQLELMSVLWSEGRAMTAAEIWQVVNAQRPVARTTIVTLLKRLSMRGWLAQHGGGRGATYEASCDQTAATDRISQDFLERFFGGSASRFVMNLVGSNSLTSAEAQKLKQLLAEYEERES